MTIQFPPVDWAALIPNLVGFFFNAVGAWLTGAIRSFDNGIWNSGANVLTQTPLDMTWDLGPISGSVGDIQNGARAVLIFALVLLGLRGILGAIVPQQPDMLAEGVNGILGAIVLTAAFPVLVPQAIDLVNQAARAVAVGTLQTYSNATGGVDDPLVLGLLGLILLFFVVRLLMKAIWRIGFLAVLLPVGMAACVLYAIPQLRWLLGWWGRTWGGMLAAQLPSTLALAIGLSFASTAGLGGFVYSIAFLQLAHDLYDLLPFGMARSQASPLTAAATAASMTRIAASLGTGAVAAAAIPANQLATRADMYGYD